MKDPYIKPEMSTVTGQNIEVYNPKPSDFVLEDISNGLSIEPRFGSQIEYDYKVAQHCCLVAMLVILDGKENIGREAQFHDSAEAYLKDVPTPLKVCLGDYHPIEKNFLQNIYKRFGLEYSEELFEEIMYYDKLALKIEKENFTKHGENWNDIQIFDGMDIPTLYPQTKEEAKQTFEAMNFLLMEGRVDEARQLDIGVELTEKVVA